MQSISEEDYLRGIYHLMEENHQVKSVQLADYLNISKPSVTEMLQHMDKEQLISYKKYSKLELTGKGQMIAKKLTFKHRVIETFLKDILKVHTKGIHEEANRLEHAFSDDSIKKLRKFLGNPKTDPHGKPIP